MNPFSVLGPYADLHRHLDGSLRLETLQDLADKLSVAVPDDLRFFQGMGLHEALSRFEVTLGVLQTPDAVKRVAGEICEDARSDNVTNLEIRFAPQLHKGAPIQTIVDAALDGIAGRAGLILCTLFGEPPETPVQLVDIAATRPGVVGLDLAGGPSGSDRWAMTDYAEAFDRARQLGIGRTVHAGEGRPPGEIRTAIEQLHAQRIGHGTTMLDDMSVVDLVLERGVTIEACPTSNMHVGAIPTVGDHPIARWLELGIEVCVCPDNTLLSDVTSSEEHRRVSEIPGIGHGEIVRVIDAGHRALFSR